MKKLRVGILFGGQSTEHEVSLLSAKNVITALDKEKFEPVLIGIDKKGAWHLQDNAHYLLNETNPKLIALNKTAESLTILPGSSNSSIISQNSPEGLGALDVVFPVLHGPNGEDGTVQGLLKLLNIPFVGVGLLGSAVNMDKDVMKRLLRDAKLPIGRFHTLHRTNKSQPTYEDLTSDLGTPFFVKPCSAGSSIGVSKVKNRDDYANAIKEALRFDRKILVEEFLKGREIECAVLGNENPISSLPGEIIPKHEFYSYEAKYIDDNGAALEVPAKLSPHLVEEAQKLAVESYKALLCEGMSRVDFFLTDDEKFYVNEINTIPGFTNISMYPKLWEISGISNTELITKLIEFAIERHEEEKKSEVVGE